MMSTTSDANRIIIFDTTLRDGEQSPGATMTLEEKLEIAQLLDTMGVDVIEAGFPASSPGEMQAVDMIARALTKPVICGLARMVPRDIDAARKALEGALPYASDVRNIKFLFLPPEHDPDSFIREYGADAFARSVGSAMPLSRFVMESARDGCELETAEGRAMLAFQPQEVVDEVLAQGFVPRTPKTIINEHAIRKAIEEARVKGFAVEDEQSELGMRSVAAPIRNANGRVIAAIGLAGPMQRISDEALASFAPLVADAARTISARLGYNSLAG